MRVALAIVLALVPAAGLADTVEDRYGPPPPSHHAVPPAPVSYPTHAQAEAASSAVGSQAAGYRGRYLSWSSKAGLRGPSGPAEPGPQAAAPPRPQTLAATGARSAPFLRGAEALPQNLYDHRPTTPASTASPALRGAQPAQAYAPPPAPYPPPAVSGPALRPQSYAAAPAPQPPPYQPPPRPARAAPVETAMTAPPPRVVQSAPPQRAYTPPVPAPSRAPPQTEAVAAARVPTTPVQSAAMPPAQPRVVATARSAPPKPATAAPAPTQTAAASAQASAAGQAQVAAAAPPPNAPWAAAHVRFYSLHRDYGDTPDPIPTQPPRAPVLVGPGDGAAMPEDAPAAPGHATSPTAGLF